MNNLTITNNTKNQRFETTVCNDIAYIEYRWHGNQLALMHTLVPEKNEGQGIAGQLAKAALEFAKKEGHKVLAYCTYVQSYIKRHPEYESLLADASNKT